MSLTNDEEALAKKAKEDVSLEKQDELDLANVLSSEYGRRLIWRVLVKCNTFGELWASNSEIHRNVAKADVGKWLYRECKLADAEACFKMEQENNGVKK